MRIIDMHCDTLMKAVIQSGKEADLLDFPSTMVDFRRMQKGDILAQFFAIFMITPEKYNSLYGTEPGDYSQYITDCVTVLNHSTQAHSDIIAQARTAEEIEYNRSQGKMSAVLTMEDGVAVAGKLENLEYFKKLGVSALSLTWNYENCFGYPNSTNPEEMKRGLKHFGLEAVEYMQELGILVDVSHLSDGGFYDVAAIAKKPFVATHSDCRSLSPHPRNLTDDMLRILGEKGGVAGINFYPVFMNRDSKNRDSTVERMVEIAKHMKNTGGIDIVGIGSDFDGIGGNLEISGSDKLVLLEAGLERAGFTGSEVDQILGGNALRVMKEAVR